MKKFFPALLSLLLLLLPCAAHADIIYEPFEDDFYAEHSFECESTYHWRRYQTAPDVPAPVMQSPLSQLQIDTLQPKSVITTNTTWVKNGEIWYYWGDILNPGSGGWINGEYLTRIYDADLFMEDHRTDIASMHYSLPVSELNGLYVCYFPGGELMEGDFSYAFHELQNRSDLVFDQTYLDMDGRLWGYLSYLYGSVNGWICLDDPNLETVKPADEPVLSQIEETWVEKTFPTKEGETLYGFAIAGNLVPDSTEPEDTEDGNETAGKVSESAQETTAEKITSAAQETTAKETTAAPKPASPEETAPIVVPTSAPISNFGLIGIGVGAIVLITAVILVIVLKKKK